MFQKNAESRVERFLCRTSGRVEFQTEFPEHCKMFDGHMKVLLESFLLTKSYEGGCTVYNDDGVIFKGYNDCRDFYLKNTYL